MRNKTMHAKLLSLLLAIVMVLSTAVVFAEGDDTTPSITISPTEATIKVGGDDLTLTATTVPANADVTWTSSNEEAATVDAGVVHAVAASDEAVTITATIEGAEPATCSVTVEAADPAEPTISLDKTSVSVDKGKTDTITATTTNAEGKNVVWTSSDESIATVSDGTVTGVAKGSATITATIEGTDVSATCSVTVTEPEQDPAITLNATSKTIKVGESFTLSTTKLVPAGATITWSSSNTKVATVTNGTVKGVAEGSANITATVSSNGKTATATCAVKVEPSNKPAAPSGIKAATRYGKNDNGLTISWSYSGPAVTGFEILRGKSADVSKMTKIASVAKDKRSLYRLEGKGTFYYAVKAINANGSTVSAASPKVVIEGNIITTNLMTTNGGLVWYSHTKGNVTVYKTANLKGKVATLKKGTYVIAIDKSPAKVKKFKQPSKVKIKTKDGKVVGWVKYKQLSGGVHAATDVKNDYTRSVKEDFVNGKGYTSPNKYLIWVSPRTQRAYLFKGKKGQWKLQKSFRVTTGRFSHKTAPYHSKISKKKSKVFMVTEKGKRYYYKYASYFASGVSFHSGTWWASNNKVRGVMNKKGVPQTFGCLRMTTENAKWIYDTIPINTTVIVTQKA